MSHSIPKDTNKIQLTKERYQILKAAQETGRLEYTNGATISASCGLSRQRVNQQLDVLVKKGFLTKPTRGLYKITEEGLKAFLAYQEELNHGKRD